MSHVEGADIDNIGDDVWDESIKSIEELALISGGGAPIPRIRALFLSWCDYFPQIRLLFSKNNLESVFCATRANRAGAPTRATRFVQRRLQQLADVLFRETPMQKRPF